MKMSLCVCLLVNPIKLIGPFTLIFYMKVVNIMVNTKANYRCDIFLRFKMASLVLVVMSIHNSLKIPIFIIN